MKLPDKGSYPIYDRGTFYIAKPHSGEEADYKIKMPTWFVEWAKEYYVNAHNEGIRAIQKKFRETIGVYQ
jgi:hypothetical protein